MTIAVKCRPFNAYQHEVKAILEGKQTMFRRVITRNLFGPSDNPNYDWRWRGQNLRWHEVTLGTLLFRYCPYGQVGDRLWLKEIWRPWSDKDVIIQYKATPDDLVNYPEQPRFTFACGGYWRPSIHLPRWASRITLEITGVKVERIQDISQEDLVCEGMEIQPGVNAFGFDKLWNSINAKKGYGWDANPYVFVPTFKVVS